jgi:hypothetical protein
MKRLTIAILISACGASAPPPEVAEEELPIEEPYVVALRLEDAGEEGDTPHTRVVLVRISPEGDRELTELRTEMGACYERPEVGALIAAHCWWAGAGARYVVRRDRDAVVALRADEDEEAGSGELAEVARLPIPEDARVEVVGARQ